MMVLGQLVIFTFLVLVTSSLSAASSPSYEDVINTRLMWEKNCLVPATGGAQSSTGGPGHGDDPRLKVDKACTLFYLHNHKTGGSTMCKTAAANHMKISGLPSNCNVPLQIRSNKHINIQEYIFENKLEFVAQEDKPLRINVSNSRFVFMTTFRNPMDRVVSHLHHELCGKDGSEMDRNYETHHCMSKPGTLSDLIADPCFGGQMKPITTDFYLAMLTGCTNRRSRLNHPGISKKRISDEEWFMPPDKNTCSEVHLEESKRLLHYFSVILISDHPADFDRYGELLDLKFSLTFEDQYRSGTHANSDSVVDQLLKHNASSHLALQMVTSLDMQLYKYAKELAEARLHEEQKSGSVAALRSFHKAQSGRSGEGAPPIRRKQRRQRRRRRRRRRLLQSDSANDHGSTVSSSSGQRMARSNADHMYSAFPTHSASPEIKHEALNRLRARMKPKEVYVEGPMC